MSRLPVIITPDNAPHVPTSETREKVKYMVACGLEVPQISFLLECTPYEVQFHYKDELTHGVALVNAQVGMRMLQAIMAGDMASAQYWLKTRAKWVPPSKAPEETDAAADSVTDGKIRRQLMDEIVDLLTADKRKMATASLNQKTPASSRRVQ